MDNDLGRFLRSCREAVTPAQAGLPTGDRRRTPGLRRSELATLAGVSMEYVTRLEQGRDQHPSAQVLSALADALQLRPHQRIHLHELAKAESGFRCTEHPSDDTDRDIPEAVRTLVQQLEPAAAVLLDRRCEVLVSTATYQALMTPTGLFDGTPNVATYVFTDPRARDLYPDWDHVADDVVAQLKRGPFRADRGIAALADELTATAGGTFTDRVEHIHELPAPTGITRLEHPDVGPLRLTHETLTMLHRPMLQLIVQQPADAATGAALERLTRERLPRHAGNLRVV